MAHPSITILLHALITWGTPCKGDPDVWMKKAEKPDGETYWEYILVYVDNVMVIGMT